MRSATGAIQSVLVLGAASEIAGAILDSLDGSRLQRVDLAVRDVASVADRATALRAGGIVVRVIAYDARDDVAHDLVVTESAAQGDIDLVIVSFGVLGPLFDLGSDPAETVSLVGLNGAQACGAVHAAARRLELQGHGALVVLSSVAGQRVRSEIAAYGAGKAALDGFTRAVADRLVGSGVHVLLVRPGFVRGRMTKGRPEVPFATTPQAVAADIVDALARRSTRTVWSPRSLKGVFAAVRVLPGPIWRRLEQ